MTISVLYDLFHSFYEIYVNLCFLYFATILIVSYSKIDADMYVCDACLVHNLCIYVHRSLPERLNSAIVVVTMSSTSARLCAVHALRA